MMNCSLNRLNILTGIKVFRLFQLSHTSTLSLNLRIVDVPAQTYHSQILSSLGLTFKIFKCFVLLNRSRFHSWMQQFNYPNLNVITLCFSFFTYIRKYLTQFARISTMWISTTPPPQWFIITIFFSRSWAQTNIFPVYSYNIETTLLQISTTPKF